MVKSERAEEQYPCVFAQRVCPRPRPGLPAPSSEGPWEAGQRCVHTRRGPVGDAGPRSSSESSSYAQLLSPWLGGRVGWSVVRLTKGYGLYSRSQHMPRLWVRPPVERVGGQLVLCSHIDISVSCSRISKSMSSGENLKKEEKFPKKVSLSLSLPLSCFPPEPAAAREPAHGDGSQPSS